MKEIESIDLQKSQDKKNLNESKISWENDVSSGSDSEPSLDNFDNEQLVRLLPTYSKKKSKLIVIYKIYLEKFLKKPKKISFSSIKTKEKISIDSNKNKISIITNIEVNINNNQQLNNNNLNIITNLNINQQRPVSLKKQIYPPSSALTVTQSNQMNNNKNNLMPLINLKPLDNIQNKTRILQTSQKINEKPQKQIKTKEAQTQTEEIFFKMYFLLNL